jgi:hypothetical protein
MFSIRLANLKKQEDQLFNNTDDALVREAKKFETEFTTQSSGDNYKLDIRGATDLHK